MRRIIAGLVGGSLGAAVGIGLFGMLIGLLGDEELSSAAVQSSLLAGTGFAVALAFVVDKLPSQFIVRVAVVFAVVLIGEIVASGAAWIPAMVVAIAAYSAVVNFILHQVIEVPLPNAAMARRSEEFHDDPAGMSPH